MKRGIAIIVGLLLAALTAPAAMQDTITPDIAWECPEDFSGQTLSVYNWATYIGENTVADFETLCNVTVNYDTFDNNDTMIARLRQGNPGYDVAFANTYAIEILARENLITPFNPEDIPNLANLGERWTGLEHDPEGVLSVPYLWGTTGVLYNKTKITEPITSWQQVFEYDGPVAWINDSRTIMGIGLSLSGYDPNTANPEEIAVAKEFMLANSANVVVIANDDGQTLLEAGEVDIAIEYSGDAYQLITECECDDYGYAVPAEGSVVDMAAMFIPVDAPNVRLAEAFMDYILDPKVNAEIVLFTTYATPNQAAIDSGFIDEELVTNPAVFPDDDLMAKVFFIKAVEETEQAFSDAWDELLILVGS